MADADRPSQAPLEDERRPAPDPVLRGAPDSHLGQVSVRKGDPRERPACFRPFEDDAAVRKLELAGLLRPLPLTPDDGVAWPSSHAGKTLRRSGRPAIGNFSETAPQELRIRDPRLALAAPLLGVAFFPFAVAGAAQVDRSVVQSDSIRVGDHHVGAGAFLGGGPVL